MGAQMGPIYILLAWNVSFGSKEEESKGFHYILYTKGIHWLEVSRLKKNGRIVSWADMGFGTR